MNRQNQPIVDLYRQIEEWIASRQMSYQDYHQIFAIVFSDNQIDETERQQLDRLFAAVRSGQIRVVQ